MAIDWSKIKHFTAAEFGAHADKLDEQLIENLDDAREKLDTEIIVTSAYRPGDAGFHGDGLAIDLMLPNWMKTAYDAYLILQTCGFTGVGVYPYWKYRGKMMFGFHVDMRPKMARWIGLGSSKTDAQYVMFSNDNLKKYGLMK